MDNDWEKHFKELFEKKADDIEKSWDDLINKYFPVDDLFKKVKRADPDPQLVELSSWLRVLRHPLVILILGGRGWGKSALGYKIAEYLKGQSEAHDKKLLEHLSAHDPDRFWEESERMKDQFNVCGFSALACLLEILPPCKGQILGYERWHEEPTRSAVSFAAVAFTD